MRRTVTRLRFIPDGNGNFRSCECEFGYKGTWTIANEGDIVITKPSPIFTVMQFIGTTWSNKTQKFWLRDTYSNYEYPVSARDFESMIPHLQNGYIIGLFNPTTNSANRHTLEYMDVQINIRSTEDA